MGFNPKTQNRHWIVTMHVTNFENAGLTEEQYKDPEFLADYLISLWTGSGTDRKAAVSVCVSSQGCYHAHIACTGNTTTLKRVSDIYFQSHVEPQKGGKKELTAYMLKEGKYEEKGERVLFSKGMETIQDAQGARTDLELIEEMLREGKTPEEIYAESFRFRRYDRMIRSEFLAQRIKETPLIKEMFNEYHWGSSGTGKTYTYIQLYEKHGEENVYICNDYSNSGGSGGGFDMYANNPAKYIVLDEFRGNMPYNTLLSLLDKYSRNQQHCRYANTYALWTNVYICTVYPIEKVYEMMVGETSRTTDTFQQLMRRINKIVYHYRDINGEYKTFEMLPSEYISGRNMQLKAAISENFTLIEEHANEVNDSNHNEMLCKLDSSHMAKLLDYATDTNYKVGENNA